MISSPFVCSISHDRDVCKIIVRIIWTFTENWIRWRCWHALERVWVFTDYRCLKTTGINWGSLWMCQLSRPLITTIYWFQHSLSLNVTCIVWYTSMSSFNFAFSFFIDVISLSNLGPQSIDSINLIQFSSFIWWFIIEILALSKLRLWLWYLFIAIVTIKIATWIELNSLIFICFQHAIRFHSQSVQSLMVVLKLTRNSLENHK